MANNLLSLIIVAAIIILIYMSLWFIVSLIIKRNDVADIAWGFGFVVAAIGILIKTQNHSLSAYIVTFLILVWGLRLSLHIGLRNIKKSEDFRYQNWRENWGKWFILRSYLQIFILQGFLMLVILLPALVIYAYSNSVVHPLIFLGIALWIFGFSYESISDKQLKKFLSQPENKGHIMNQGLWKYSRHPNYFGEISQWWGIGIVALSNHLGWIGLLGPLTITFLIVKVSGIPLLEKKYAANAQYQQYKARTSSLIPLPSKNSD